jgi:WD40 repeat protein
MSLSKSTSTSALLLTVIFLARPCASITGQSPAKEPNPDRALSSPLDKLNPQRIRPELRLKGQPPELVALLDVRHGPRAVPKKRSANAESVAVTGFALARTGRLASGCKDKTLRLWDLTGEQPEQRLSFSCEAPPGLLALSRDGRTLALADSGLVKVWDVSTAKPRLRLQRKAHDLPNGWGVTYLALSPDDKVLLSGGVDNMVRFWDLTRDEPTEQRTFKTQGMHCTSCFRGAESGPLLASYGQNWVGADPRMYQPSPTVRVWDLAQSKVREMGVLKHEVDVACVAISPDGRSLVTGGGYRSSNQPQPAPGMLRLWLLNENGPARSAPMRLVGHKDPVNAATYSPDGHILASAGSEGHVILWESATGKKYRQWQLPGPVNRLAFADDGRHLIILDGEGTLYVLRLGQKAPSVTDEHALWEALASADAERAWTAIWTLVGAPHRAVVLLNRRLQPVEHVAAKHIQALIERLSDDRFAERAKATAALTALGDLAEPALRRCLAERTKSLETRQRIERLLEKPSILTLSRLRTLRAIQILEQIGNREARKTLDRLAGGAPEALETRQARTALVRLLERSAALP